MATPLDQAIALHQAGALDRAEALYRRVLAVRPNDADAARLLGLLLHQVGRAEEAVRLLERAAARHGGDAALRDVLGVALKALGRLEAAAAAFRAAAVLDPSAFGPRYNLGNALAAAGDAAGAAAAFRAALAIDSGHAWAWHNLADALRLLERPQEAAAAAQHAVTLAPQMLAFRLGWGACLAASGQDDAAAAQLRLVIQAEPGNGLAQRLIAPVLAQLGDRAAAGLAYRAAVRLLAEDAALLTEVALFHQHDAAYAAAEALFQRAVVLSPGSAMALNNLAYVLCHLGKYTQSETAFRQALALDPDLAAARYGLGLTLLSAGCLPDGFAAYEARWDALVWTSRFPPPVWDGTPAPEKTLLIHAEQGFGDMIQMSRYVALAAQRARVVLEAPAPLVRLFAGLEVERVVAFGEDLPAFDLHCPAMSLPLAFGTTRQTIPRAVPYLHAEPALAAAWQARLAGLPGLRVGLVWKTGLRFKQAHLKSMPAEALAPLGEVTGVSFVSLQTDAAGPPPFPMADWTAELTDFADTAALIAGLDLVISVDTAVAHLAGAMGKTVWVMVPFAADWRWLGGGDDWYPTARVFRQAVPEAWEEVVGQVREALTIEYPAVRQ